MNIYVICNTDLIRIMFTVIAKYGHSIGTTTTLGLKTKVYLEEV